MLTPIVGVGINVGGSAHEAQADLTVRVPHPLFLEAFASADAPTDIPMQRIERSVNVQVMLVALRTPHFRLRAFGGPSSSASSRIPSPTSSTTSSISCTRPATSPN